MNVAQFGSIAKWAEALIASAIKWSTLRKKAAPDPAELRRMAEVYRVRGELYLLTTAGLEKRAKEAEALAKKPAKPPSPWTRGSKKNGPVKSIPVVPERAAAIAAAAPKITLPLKPPPRARPSAD